jgi:hypothetical protein
MAYDINIPLMRQTDELSSINFEKGFRILVYESCHVKSALGLSTLRVKSGQGRFGNFLTKGTDMRVALHDGW